ncbi:adenosine deaminase [Streptomyces sp. A3M-1-3]|uniref:adenosine deaminase family protein n=1 Tax=Streptomyces sp. A3M-1-3 TaxID=2962044 RepID=UPI0020B6D740|nr:adenosine deaminase [Streptomyces sp. A3M-1-3]MCP3816646.1 adenosine deaminase [Streptomyces sp. A3M-1-3]
MLPALPAAAAQPPAPPPVRTTAAEERVAAHLDAIRNRPEALRAFIRDLPKGGDLHNHLSGAASTELLIQLAAEDGLCIDTKTLTAVPAPCGAGARPATDALADNSFRQQVIRAWSMQDLPAGENGHDHFFATFGRFGEVAWRNRGKLLAEVANTAVEQNQFYLETMVSPASTEARELADAVGFDEDLDRMHDALLAGGRLDAAVKAARAEADAADAQFRGAAHCDSPRPDPGCALPVRWISQVLRGSSHERVFTEMALGMRLAERDPRFVAVNLVQPEDWDSSLRNYRQHMRMLDHLRREYPGAHITLHAGELTPGLVKPEDLSFHIREAVLTGHAERIGHGVDVLHEDNPQQLLRTMAARRVAVEVPFTSNEQILGVSGAEHPFMTYRRYGVPVVLATDDPGVSRSDMSAEYLRAAQMYGLSYPALKHLARASLDHAFLPGRSLWRGNPARLGHVPAAPCRQDHPGAGTPSRACAAFLAASPKATLEWRQEAAFTRFEGRRLMRTPQADSRLSNARKDLN